MKVKITLIVTLLIGTVTCSQPPVTDMTKTISVTGSAEMEIIPDQVYVNITLREYQRKGTGKKSLEELKSSFLAACSQVNLPDSLVSVVQYNGYGNYYQYWKSKKKDNDFMAAVTYQVRFSGSEQIEKLIDKLDDEGTQAFQVILLTHSRILQIRKELKIKAVIAAKEKAAYLLEAIGQSLGPVLKVVEPVEYNFDNRQQYSNSNELHVEPGEPGRVGTSDFKKIKIRYEVAAIFGIG